MSLRDLYGHFHVCLFTLLCKLLWPLSHTNSVIVRVIMDDGVCRCTANKQLVVLLNHTINSYNTAICEVVREYEQSSTTAVLPF